MVGGGSVLRMTAPVREPCSIFVPGALYSASWSISGLVRTKSKNWLTCWTRLARGPCSQATPQKKLKTWTAGSSGPPRYVSLGGAAGAAAARSWSGTIWIGFATAISRHLRRGSRAGRARDERGARSQQTYGRDCSERVGRAERKQCASSQGAGDLDQRLHGLEHALGARLVTRLGGAAHLRDEAWPAGDRQGALDQAEADQPGHRADEGIEAGEEGGSDQRRDHHPPRPYAVAQRARPRAEQRRGQRKRDERESDREGVGSAMRHVQ